MIYFWIRVEVHQYNQLSTKVKSVPFYHTWEITSTSSGILNSGRKYLILLRFLSQLDIIFDWRLSCFNDKYHCTIYKCLSTYNILGSILKWTNKTKLNIHWWDKDTNRMIKWLRKGSYWECNARTNKKCIKESKMNWKQKISKSTDRHIERCIMKKVYSRIKNQGTFWKSPFNKLTPISIITSKLKWFSKASPKYILLNYLRRQLKSGKRQKEWK